MKKLMIVGLMVLGLGVSQVVRGAEQAPRAGESALMVAARNNNVEIVSALLRTGENINFSNLRAGANINGSDGLRHVLWEMRLDNRLMSNYDDEQNRIIFACALSCSSQLLHGFDLLTQIQTEISELQDTNPAAAQQRRIILRMLRLAGGTDFSADLIRMLRLPVDVGPNVRWRDLLARGFMTLLSVGSNHPEDSKVYKMYAWLEYANRIYGVIKDEYNDPIVDWAALLALAGIYVDRQDSNGSTALIRAAHGDDLLRVKRLLSLNADPFVRNNNGQNALGVRNNQQVGAMLYKAMQDCRNKSGQALDENLLPEVSDIVLDYLGAEGKEVPEEVAYADRPLNTVLPRVRVQQHPSVLESNRQERLKLREEKELQEDVEDFATGAAGVGCVIS